MPLGLGWEDPTPTTGSGSDIVAGSDASTAADDAAAPPPAHPRSSPGSANGKSRKTASTGTRSDGRKTSNTRKNPRKKSNKSSSSGKKNASSNGTGGGSGKMKSSSLPVVAVAGEHERPDPLPRTTSTGGRATGGAADTSTAAAFASGAPEEAEDEAPSPHRHKSGSGSGRKKKTSAASAGRVSSSSGGRKISARSSRSGSGGGNTNTKKAAARSSSSSNKRTSSSRSGKPSSSSGGARRKTSGSSSNTGRRSKSASGRGTGRSSGRDGAAAAAAAATAAAAAASPPESAPSPTTTDNTRETSYESWKENGSADGDGDGDIEAGSRRKHNSSSPSSSPKRSSDNKKRSGGGSNRKGGGGGAGGSRKSSGSSSGRKSRSRRKSSGYVSCLGWEWKKTHLLAAFMLLLVAAGGAVAALLFTGILGTGTDKSTTTSDFASITDSPTIGPTSLPGVGGGDYDDSSSAGISNTGGGARRPTPRPTIASPATITETDEPKMSPEPTISPRPTSCTETTDLFKYFDDSGSVVTTSCKKVALSTEEEEVKCQRTVVFGGGSIVQDFCPLTCGLCSDDPSPTEEPTAFTLEPTPAPVPAAAVPTIAVQSEGSANDPDVFSGHDTFSFYVMGDIPYLYKQEMTLIEQLRDQTNNLDPEEEIFQVHVGDIQNPKRSQCASSYFDKIAGYFKTYSEIPNLMLPGDNDWNDCPNPDLAWEYFSSNFIPFEQYWSDRSDFPSTVMRQNAQPENFAFVRGGILFLGLNLVGGSTNEYITQADWDKRVDNDIAWGKYHFDRLNVGSPNADPRKEDYIRGIIVFGHSPRGRRFNNFLLQELYNVDIPVTYIHGNGHTYEAVQPFLSEGWSNYWRIQVDQGANAPPLKVTVRGTTTDALRLSMNVNGGKVFPGGFIKLDRRGGLYEGAVATDADGNPLISGFGG